MQIHVAKESGYFLISFVFNCFYSYVLLLLFIFLYFKEFISDEVYEIN